MAFDPWASSKREYPRMTLDEFLAISGEDLRSEWIGGEVLIVSPSSRKHQELCKLLLKIVDCFAEEHDLGIVIGPPFLMVMKKIERAREPDLIFVSGDRAHLVKETYLDGPADIAVEIVSPDSIERDHREKLAEYEAAGVREYWLIDPLEDRADFYSLDGDRYRSMPIEDGVFRSAVVPGFFLPLEWLWASRPPTTIEAQRALGLLD